MTTQRWEFEPGHSAAQFSVRHMMVTDVRGHLNGIEGFIEIDPDNPTTIEIEASMSTADLWSGDTHRDEHLRNADFFDVENHPQITFKADEVSYVGTNDMALRGNVTIRGITKPVTLNVQDLGRWPTPFWEDGQDKGPVTRAGFRATTKLNRQDFGVSWNSMLDKGGVVVGDTVDITIDIEALLRSGSADTVVGNEGAQQ